MNVLLLLFLLVASPVSAGQMFHVNTGYGYFVDENDKFVAFANLIEGDHPIKDGFRYVEVDSKADLDKVVVPVVQETKEQERERVIQEKIRELAIEELKKDGQWKLEYDQ